MGGICKGHKMWTPWQEIVALNREGACGLSKTCEDNKLTFQILFTWS